MRERKKTKGDIPGDLVMAMVDYTSGSPEMQVSNLCKKTFTDWTMDLLNKHGQWPKKDIIDSGAYVSGGNPQTCRRYLDALKSSVGSLQEDIDQTRTVIIRFRKR